MLTECLILYEIIPHTAHFEQIIYFNFYSSLLICYYLHLSMRKIRLRQVEIAKLTQWLSCLIFKMYTFNYDSIFHPFIIKINHMTHQRVIHDQKKRTTTAAWLPSFQVLFSVQCMNILHNNLSNKTILPHVEFCLTSVLTFLYNRCNTKTYFILFILWIIYAIWKSK